MKKYPAKIFYCYSHKDEDLRNELEKHLKMLERQNIITNWHDRKLVPGTEWKSELSKKLNTCDLVLLLVSQDFIVSDYCYEKEMKQALKLHSENKVQIIPIILRKCDWKNTPFANIQGLPTDMVPVKDSKWNTLDDAFDNIREGLKVFIQELFEVSEFDKPEGDSFSNLGSEIADVKIYLDTKYIDSSFNQDDIKSIIADLVKTTIIYKSYDRTNKILLLSLPIKHAFKLKSEWKKNEIKQIKEIHFSIRSNLKSFDGIFDRLEVRNAMRCFRAVQSPIRQKIIKELQENTVMTINDIKIKLKLTESITSQHLAILRFAKIIESARKGKYIYYSLNESKIKIQ